MRWPWSRHETAEDKRARHAAATSEVALEREFQRLEEATDLAARLASHRERNRFAEAMRIAFGGRPQ